MKKSKITPYPNRKRRFGDRCDGFLLRKLNATAIAMPHIMPSRSDSQVMSDLVLDCGKIDTFINQQRGTLKGLSVQTLCFAAILRTYAKYPRLNRFISASKVYGRDDFKLSMVVKPSMSIDSEETEIALKCTMEDTLYDVVEKYKAAYEKAISEANHYAGKKYTNPVYWLGKCGRLILFLDRHGFLPASIIDMSCFHASVFVTNIGSLGLGAPYHHLYEIGTVSLFIALGQKEYVNTLESDGTVTRRKTLKIRLTADERICDGFYLVSAFKFFKRLMENPSQLLEAPLEVNYDEIDEECTEESWNKTKSPLFN